MINKYKVEISGLNIDSTIEHIAKQGVVIKNIKRETHTQLEFIVDKKDYNKISPYLKEYEAKITHYGFATFKKFLASTLAIWIALPICFFMSAFCSKYLWEIEINGLQDIKESEILNILNENGIKVGNKKNYSLTEIENIILENGNIAQVSCYYRGTCLIINISEKLVWTPIEFQPIRAKYNGIITDYKLIKGTINFVIGEYVNAGDILIFPYIIDKGGNKVSVEPQAEIFAKNFIVGCSIMREKETVLIKSGKTKTEYEIYFNNKKFSGKSNKPFVFYEVVMYNEYISDILPFIRRKLVYYELVETTKINDLSENKLIVEEESKIIAENLLPTNSNIELITQDTQSVIVNGVLYASTTISFMGSII